MVYVKDVFPFQDAIVDWLLFSFISFLFSPVTIIN